MYVLSKHKHNPYLIGNRKKWLNSQSCHFVKNKYFGIKLLHTNVQCVFIVKAKYPIVSAKAVVQVDLPAYALSMHKQNALRITKGNKYTELAPSLFYSNTNVHFVDINMFATFDEIPSLPVQDIKENPKCCGQSITKDNNSNRISPLPLFFYYKCSSCGYQSVHNHKFNEIPSLRVQVIKEKPKCCGLRITNGNNSKRIGP